MTVIGKALQPTLFQQFSATVKAQFPTLARVQFLNSGKLQTPVNLDDVTIAGINAIYESITADASNLEAVAAYDMAVRERANRYNRAVVRNINKGFFGAKGQRL